MQCSEVYISQDRLRMLQKKKPIKIPIGLKCSFILHSCPSWVRRKDYLYGHPGLRLRVQHNLAHFYLWVADKSILEENSID